ncbi:MerR family transcriptional regulator [Desulfobacter postgatei]|jgi:DNA-binding transcriptional MerR regulator|uniref:helix-turn-helix domain-containing protein n=1 Tax=Desulfobacter postgatei TaxID=2293 RepID=UPI002A363F22|nr:MerR family transcriptional regulator [Desulfobacter postgatei]MDX9964485.1 MerR family transcriptional regulator [Desulfobacter postgatei]
MKNSVSISDASTETGLSQKQLREYEAKGYINEPIKVRCGSISYRYFSPEHIRQINIFAKYKNQGFTLPIAASKAYAEIAQGKENREDE